MNATTTTPPKTISALLRAIVDMRHSYELGSIAAHFGLTLAEVQAIAAAHGYPDRDVMRRHADALLQEPAPAAPDQDAQTPDTTTEPTTTASETSSAGGQQLRRVALTDLHADPDNPRDQLTDIVELADSIKEIGLLQPIVARRHGSRLIVVAGHRRLAALRHLKHTDADVLIKHDMRPDDVLAAMLIENGQRRDLDPIEEARGLLKLKNLEHLTDAEVGHKVGRNQVFVSGRLALLGLSAEDQAAVRAGDMKLVEATHRGRLNAGKVKAPGQDKGWHLAPQHQLAHLAKARCIRLQHKRGRTVGGIACGECWESVIRADERQHIHDATAQTGTCVTCGKADQ